jgi:hypothetical protein
LVRRRRRKRGLPVAPVGKVLPFLPTWNQDSPVKRAGLDATAMRLLNDVVHHDELPASQAQLAERRLLEAFLALEEGERRGDRSHELARLETNYHHALVEYQAFR